MLTSWDIQLAARSAFASSLQHAVSPDDAELLIDIVVAELEEGEVPKTYVGHRPPSAPPKSYRWSGSRMVR